MGRFYVTHLSAETELGAICWTIKLNGTQESRPNVTNSQVFSGGGVLRRRLIFT